MIEFLETNKRVGIVGPLLFNPNMSIQQSITSVMFKSIIILLFFRLSTRKRINESFIAKYQSGYFLKKGESLLGACIVVRKQLFEELGGFDENFFFTGEEGDLILNAMKKGYAICFYPKAKIIHIHSATFKKNNQELKEKILYSYYSGILYFCKKNYGYFYHVIAYWILIISLSLRKLYNMMFEIMGGNRELNILVYKLLLNRLKNQSISENLELTRLKNKEIVDRKLNKRVLVLSSDLSITGGIPRYSQYQTKVLKTLGFNVYLITGYQIGDFFKVEDFNHIYTLNLNHGERLNVLNKARLVINSILLAKNLKPDLIIANHISVFPLAYLIKKFFDIPYIVNIYGAELWSNPRSIELKSLKESHAIIADSKHTVEYAVNNLEIDKNKVFLIYDPVDVTKFKPIPLAEYEYIYEKYNIPKGKKIILTLSRLDRFKGHEIVIDLIDKFDENVIYVIGGTGTKENYLKQICLNKGVLNKKVFFTGKIEENDLPYFYNMCDVFVLISKKEQGEGEGLPLSLIEASACGKPILVGNEDGSREAVIDSKNGFIVNPRDNNEVLEKLKKLLQDDKLRLEMGAKGREIACEFFSYENFERNHIKILDNFLKGKNG